MTITQVLPVAFLLLPIGYVVWRYVRQVRFRALVAQHLHELRLVGQLVEAHTRRSRARHQRVVSSINLPDLTGLRLRDRGTCPCTESVCPHWRTIGTHNPGRHRQHGWIPVRSLADMDA